MRITFKKLPKKETFKCALNLTKVPSFKRGKKRNSNHIKMISMPVLDPDIFPILCSNVHCPENHMLGCKWNCATVTTIL